MKIVLSGYGRMGKAVEETAQGRGHEIAARIDSDADWELFLRSGLSADVVIDFSIPDVAVDNILRSFSANIPVVTGTTGWYDRFDEIRQKALDGDQALFAASNFSIGMNVVFALNRRLAHIMNHFTSYHISVEEIHHVHKVDSPSGSAITLAKDIIRHTDRKISWINRPQESEDQLEIISSRTGEVVGVHKVIFSSEIEKIELSHEAFSRKGFAIGALMAAEWLQGRKGVFGMEDMISE